VRPSCECAAANALFVETVNARFTRPKAKEAKGRAAGIIVNAGGYTTTSIAVLDALLALGLPVIEVHLSNIFRRESFRQHSLMSLAAKGVICGLGASGYLLAIDAFARLLRTEEEA